MAWFRRRSAGPASRPTCPGRLRSTWSSSSQTRRGVEAFLEPKTTVTEVTVLLIAHDGEWTRRRVPSVEAARAWGNKVGIPVYDVALVGYPQADARLQRAPQGDGRPDPSPAVRGQSAVGGDVVDQLEQQCGPGRRCRPWSSSRSARRSGRPGRRCRCAPTAGPSATNSRRNAPPCSMWPARSMPALTWRDVGDVGVHALADLVRAAASARPARRPGRRPRGPARTAPASPITPAIRLPSAMTWPPVRVEVSTR